MKKNNLIYVCFLKIKYYLYINQLNISIMIYTTSLKHYKKLKSKGISVQLVVKSDLN